MKNIERLNFCLVWVRVNDNMKEYSTSRKRLFLIVVSCKDKLYGFISTCKMSNENYHLQNETISIKIPSNNPLIGEMSLVMLDECYEIDKEQISSPFYRLNEEQQLSFLKRIKKNKDQINLPAFINESLKQLNLQIKEGDVIATKNQKYYVKSVTGENLVCYKMSIVPSEEATEVIMDYKKWFIDLSQQHHIKNEEAEYYNFLHPIYKLKVSIDLSKEVKNTIKTEVPNNIHKLWIGSFFSYNGGGRTYMGTILRRDDYGTYIVRRNIDSVFDDGIYIFIPRNKYIKCDFRCLFSEQKVMHLQKRAKAAKDNLYNH